MSPGWIPFPIDSSFLWDAETLMGSFPDGLLFSGILNRIRPSGFRGILSPGWVPFPIDSSFFVGCSVLLDLPWDPESLMGSSPDGLLLLTGVSVRF